MRRLSFILALSVMVFTQCSKPKKATCSDGILNQDEVKTDCGGSCKACETCSDGILNQDETSVDCGGTCPACGVVYPDAAFYGVNILRSKNPDTNLVLGTYSMAAKIPTGKSVKVKISFLGGSTPTGWGLQFNKSNWQFGVYTTTVSPAYQIFYAAGPLSADLSFDLGTYPVFANKGSARIEVFEDESTSVTWTKTIAWK